MTDTNQHNDYKKLLTEREQELEDRNEELEAQHEELTAVVEALKEKNLYLERALGQLNTRNQEVNQIVYRASHDLKTPITTLEGLLHLIEVDPMGDVSLYLNLAKSSTRDMKILLGTMVRYSQNIVHKDKNELVDFDALWEKLQEDISLIDGRTKVKLYMRKRIAENFFGDSYRIESTLYNLIKNSIDFRKGSKDRIDVKFKSTGGQLRVSVSDNGRGVPNDIQQDVFGMFYRGTNQSKGSGLGLYLSKKNIEAMEGTINLFSSEGTGTTVSFTVPNKKREKD